MARVAFSLTAEQRVGGSLLTIATIDTPAIMGLLAGGLALAGPPSSVTLLGVRAADRCGRLWAVCQEMAALGHSIRSAHVSTYGDEVRDVFYVIGADGVALSHETGVQLRDRVAVMLG